jgi:uncharacterized protein
LEPIRKNGTTALMRNRNLSLRAMLLPCSFVATLLVAIVPRLALAVAPNEISRTEIEFKRAGVKLLAEIADTPQSQAKGLMFRTSLGEKEAMIFSFDVASVRRFWMYNTLIPLSIMFLDADAKIIDIQDMQPCREKNPDMCLVYVSQGLAKYAIETNIGLPRKYGIKTGDRVIIKALR